jgi:hypothetical protein
MKLFLDTCCLNRPFDDQRQARIRLETEAVLLILKSIEENKNELTTSFSLEQEISRCAEKMRVEWIQPILRQAMYYVEIDPAIESRAWELRDKGFGPFDALHIGCAEAASADAFLTTDDRLIKRSARKGNLLKIDVTNPVDWVKESDL